MLIKDLPEAIKKRALECEREYTLCKETGYVYSFDWGMTEEGVFVWSNVNQGNFQPFYEFHKISPVSEWVPKEGDMVEVSHDNKTWNKRMFIYRHGGSNICISEHSQGYTGWCYIRELRTRLTRTEIAEKFSVSKDFEFVEE